MSQPSIRRSFTGRESRTGPPGTAPQGIDPTMTGEPPARGQLVRIADLQGAGDSYSQARAQVADMQRLARGAYAQTVGLTPEAAHLLTARAVLTQVSQAVASHTTAATAWGLPVRTMDLQRVHVSPLLGRAGKPKRGPSYDFHNTPVPPEDAEIACTSAMRTVLDCARLIRSDWAVVIADAALNRGLINAAEFAERARRVHHLTGAARARALPSLCSARSESPGETLLRMRLRRLGILPTEQAILSDVDGLPRVDFLVDGSLVIEFDGRAKYSMHGDPEQAHWEEKQRQDRISEAGYEVLRVTWGELWDEGALHTRVNRAQARAHGRRTRNPLR